MIISLYSIENLLYFIEKRLTNVSHMKSPGAEYGLHMSLNTEAYEYSNYNYYMALGFKILVHERNEIPLIDANGFAIMPGVLTLVAIRKSKVRDK